MKTRTSSQWKNNRPLTFLLALGLACICFVASAQHQSLKPGFDKTEYTELVRIFVKQYDSVKTEIPAPATFKHTYRSPVVGMDNRWDMWANESTTVINVRGTTKKSVSWLQNFYAAMVPATGEIKLAQDFTFQYKLADDSRAAVHVGWLIGMAYLARDIVPKIDSCYKKGTREFIIAGHSQGGAISYLLTSYLYHLQKQGGIAKDVRFKTYCSAAPKPGNLYYAFDYESLVAGGWGFNVINTADWVPQTPFSVQTLDDFNRTNPFVNVDGIIKKQKFFTRIVFRHAYKKLKKPSEKAQRNYQKYLGDYVTKIVQKSLPEFERPVFAKTNDYVRTGPTITLLAREDYFKLFPDSKEKVFTHHLLEPYLYLLEQYAH